MFSLKDGPYGLEKIEIFSLLTVQLIPFTLALTLLFIIIFV